jgi:hypothetical protein
VLVPTEAVRVDIVAFKVVILYYKASKSSYVGPAPPGTLVPQFYPIVLSVKTC